MVFNLKIPKSLVTYTGILSVLYVFRVLYNNSLQHDRTQKLNTYPTPKAQSQENKVNENMPFVWAHTKNSQVSIFI